MISQQNMLIQLCIFSEILHSTLDPNESFMPFLNINVLYSNCSTHDMSKDEQRAKNAVPIICLLLLLRVGNRILLLIVPVPAFH